MGTVVSSTACRGAVCGGCGINVAIVRGVTRCQLLRSPCHGSMSVNVRRTHFGDDTPLSSTAQARGEAGPTLLINPPAVQLHAVLVMLSFCRRLMVNVWHPSIGCG